MPASQNIGWPIKIEEFHNRLNVLEMQQQLVSVPRLCASFPFEVISGVITDAFKSLGYSAPTPDQREVLTQFIKGHDVFVSLATGGGKSLCYATLPSVFDSLRGIMMYNTAEASAITHSIVFIVSPLLALMEDQVVKFKEKGINCTYLGRTADTKSEVVAGKFQLVYLTPERIAQDLEIREMFRSPMYVNSLVAFVVDEAHCIDTW